MNTDLFGAPIIHASKQSKKAISTKKMQIVIQEVTKEEMSERGLNAVYATGQFGEWIVENRGNKTL